MGDEQKRSRANKQLEFKYLHRIELSRDPIQLDPIQKHSTGIIEVYIKDNKQLSVQIHALINRIRHIH